MGRLGIVTVASGGFSGFFPIAPGTAGTVVAVFLAWWMRNWSLQLWIALLIPFFALSVWSAHKAGKIFKIVDAKYITVDEVVGFLVTMLGNPITWYWLFWGFVWFRLFDIYKPPPANFFDEKVKNGFGVVMDDVVAGIYGNILLHLMVRASL